MRYALALLLFVASPLTAGAQCPPAFDWNGFYPSADLDRVVQRTAPGLRSNFQQVLLPRLTDQERRTLGSVRLDLDQREYAQHPLNFYAARGGSIVLPLSSIRLVSDMMFALAWLNRHRLPEKTVYDYLAMLAWRGPAPDGVRAQPLGVLGVPADDNDPAVDALFQKFFGTTMVFVMAHETGHLFHGHRAGVSEAQSRRQEREADAFAIELMARLGAPPIGVSFYFLMAAPFECPGRSTHPLSGERIGSLVDAITANAAVFARDKPDPAREQELVASIALQLAQVARLVDDPDVREAIRQVGMASNVADFAAKRSTTSPHTARLTFEGAYSGHATDAAGAARDIRMSLQRQGRIVRGTYEFGLGPVQLEGTLDGELLDYAWRWGKEYYGRGRLRSGADGKLAGTWGYGRSFEGGGTLTVTPQ
jgi:hypothetical protein